MDEFSNNFLARQPPPDGFLLKSRSPSCGLYDTPVFSGPTVTDSLPQKDGPGFFARAVLKCFPAKSVIDERRLADPATARAWLQAIGAV
jgi:uncharacterized protein YbbK (DUF523 family)